MVIFGDIEDLATPFYLHCCGVSLLASTFIGLAIILKEETTF